MEDYSISESERLQIEQILELEDEELEVEEVDGDDESSDDDDNHASGSGEYTYDTSLVPLHSYLGEVEDIQNRLSFVDAGVVLTLPLFYLEEVVLFPEATLPLRVIYRNFLAGFERALNQVDGRYTIGVIRVYKDFSSGRMRFSTTGTTAEIRQYRRQENGSVNVVARGQQRFRLRRRLIDADGAPCGEVQIIKENPPLRTPKEAVGRLSPIRNSRITNFRPTKKYEEINSDGISEGSFEGELSSAEKKFHQSALISYDSSDGNDESMSSDDEETFGRNSESRSEKSMDSSGKRVSSEIHHSSKLTCEKYNIGQLREVSRAFWPSWAYRMFDSYALARKAADRWKEVIKAPSMDGFVNRPDLLSFHIASKIPISQSARQELLEIDGTPYRLRREIELLESFDQIRCKTCQTLISRRSDMLVMSSDGPLSAYANPHGFVHEVMTLVKASGIGVTGPPVKEFSWFPGYAWSIAECIACGTQLGWHFSATNKKMRPINFWGIRSSQVVNVNESSKRQ